MGKRIIGIRGWKPFALALWLLAGGQFEAAAQTDAHWTGGGGQFDTNWNTAANWNIGVVPNNGSPTPTYNAIIDGTTNFDVQLTSNIAVNSLTHNSPTLSFVQSNNSVLQASTATISTNFYYLRGGTIQGGAWTFSGTARLSVNNNPNNILSGVLFNGTIGLDAIGAALKLTNGTNFLPGSVVTFTSGSPNATLTISQSQAVDNVTLKLNSGAILRISGLDATLGPSAVVTNLSGSGTGFGGFINSSANSLINQGTIVQNVFNTGLNVNTAGLTNTGLISAEASGTLIDLSLVSAGVFTNSGTVRAAGGTVSLSAASGFSNLSAGTLTGGTYLAQSGTINLNGRTVTALAAGTSVTLDGNSSVFAAVNTLTSNAGAFSLLGGRSFTVSGGAFTNSGTLTLGNSSATTFTGSVANNSGGLVQGLGTITGAVNVGSGSAIMGGVTGSTPGRLTVGNTTFNAGGKYVFQVKNWSASPVVGLDISQFTGGSGNTLNLSALTSPGQFTIEIRGLNSSNGIGAVTGFNAQAARSWTIAQFANDLSGTNPDRFLLDTANFAGANAGGSFTLALNASGAMILTFVPVPEPVCLLAFGGLLGSCVAVRRRRKA